MTKKLKRWMPLTCGYFAATSRSKRDLTIHATPAAFHGPYEPVCGAVVPRFALYGVRCDTPDGKGVMAMPWPPPMHGFDQRCRDCWEATGKPRPDPSWKQVVVENPVDKMSHVKP